MPIDRDIFFSKVREKPFGGKLSQEQVDGMNAILAVWEEDWEPENSDLRFLANPMAQTFHETSQRMWPIAEYGKGGSAAYAKPDPTTGEAYYGRGLIQLTWADNFKRADKEMGWTKEAGSSCYWEPDLQLRLAWAVPTMFIGMNEGWFRTTGGTPNTLSKYFTGTKNDILGSRDIINGDVNVKPSWANGKTIGQLITDYHNAFMAALTAAYVEPLPEPEPTPEEQVVTVIINAPPGIRVDVQVVQED